MDHKGSLPHSQEPTTAVFPGPDESNLHFPTPFPCGVKEGKVRPCTVTEALYRPYGA